MNRDQIINAARNHLLITEPKRGGVYRLSFNVVKTKQLDGRWEDNIGYQEVSTGEVYSRPLSMFHKFTLYEVT